MKTLRLIFEFFSRNKIPTIIICLTFTATLFFANYTVGIYRYITYTRDLFVNTETENSIYCMPKYNDDVVDLGIEMDRIEEGAKKYKAYTPFKRTQNFTAFVNGAYTRNFLFTSDMVEEYRLPLSQGNWNDLKNDDGECFNAIISGKRFDYLNVGDIIGITLYEDPNSIIKVKVVGKLANPDVAPDFTIGGSIIYADDLYKYLDGMIFLKSDRLVNTINNISGYNAVMTQSSFMTAYKSGSSEAEKAEYREFLCKEGIISDYSEILESTNEIVENQLRRSIPTPLFLLGIATLSLISLSVLFVNKKLKEHSIYYLCGCNRGKSYFIISCAIALIGLFGGLINILFIASYDFLTTNGIVNMRDGLIYDEYSMLFTILYTLAVSLVSVIISLLIFRKSSPIEIYRKFET